MIRIDRIKKCVDGVVPWHTNWTDTDVEDAKYLLSKLELAEKALDDLRFKTQVIASHCALQKDRYENVQAAYAFEKTQAIYEGIDTVIKQLRE